MNFVNAIKNRAINAKPSRMARQVVSTRWPVGPRHVAVLALSLSLLAFAGCGNSDEASEVAGKSTEGAALFDANCAACHGSNLRGTSKGPSLLSSFYEPNHHGDQAFRSAIAAGSPQHHWTFGNMPPVPGLNDDEVTAIISYVRTIQDREGFDR